MTLSYRRSVVILVVESGSVRMENLSPLGLKLQTLVDTGVVAPSPEPLNSPFPTARIVVPVYNSTGTLNVETQCLTGVPNAQLEQRS
jgi:hypothetical protein